MTTSTTKKSLSRRATLKGLGTAIALPFLDAMRPARAQSTSSPRPRLLFFFVPCGINMATFTPSQTGAGFDLPDMLEPLDAVRERVSVLSGVRCTAALDQGDGPGDHARGTSTFLTATHPNKSETRVQNGVSVDQVAAQAWRGQTPLSSLELGCEPGGAAGTCDVGYSCAYVHHIAWASATTPLPKETNPRAVFDRLFQASDAALSPQAREEKRRRRRSVLDFVKDDARRLQGRLGNEDRRRLDDYLSGVRELERRVESQATSTCEVPDRPDGADEDTGAYVRQMLDLAVVAFRCDLTRVVTFMLGNGGSNRAYGFLGHPGSHHEYSHHNNDRDKLAALEDIGRFEVAQLAYLMEQLQAVDDDGATLLDRSGVVLGSEIEDGNAHTHTNLPLLVGGGLDGRLRTGAHLDLPSSTELGDVHLTLLRAAGLDKSTFGDDGRRVIDALLR
jgi:hypothetical protein